MGFICETEAPAPTTTPVSASKADVHVTGTFNGNTYIMYDESMTWSEAKAFCEALGGHLAVITSSEENDFIRAMVEMGSKYHYWLGGTDASHEGTWGWITGDDWRYTDWNGDSPNNTQWTSDGEDYLAFSCVPEAGIWGWDDLTNECTTGNTDVWGLDRMGFICEIEASSPTPPGNTVVYSSIDEVINDQSNISTPIPTLTPVPASTQALTATPTPTPSSIQTVYCVVQKSSKGRSGPGTEYDEVTSLAANHRYPVLEEATSAMGVKWYRISADGVECWVSSNRVIIENDRIVPEYTVAPTVALESTSTPATTPTLYCVVKKSCKTRKGPGTEYDVVISLSANARYLILEKATSTMGVVWYRINVNGMYCWVSSNLVTTEK